MWCHLLPTLWLYAQARATGMVQRQRKVDPVSLFWMLVLSFGIGKEHSIAILRRAYEEATGVMQILRLWDIQQVDPLGERVLEQKVQSAYRDAPIADEVDAITINDIKTPDELVAEYDAYIEKLKTHRITLGWPEVDERLRGIAPGEVLGH